jgi:hypothetical protein
MFANWKDVMLLAKTEETRFYKFMQEEDLNAE